MSTLNQPSFGLNLLGQIIIQQQHDLSSFAERQRQKANPNLFYLEKGNSHIQALTDVYNSLEDELSGATVRQQPQQFPSNSLTIAEQQPLVAWQFPDIWQQTDKLLPHFLKDCTIGSVLIRLELPNTSNNTGFINLSFK